MSAREPMTAALERLRADIHARWTARLTPALNTPTKEDLLSFMGEVDEAFTAALAADPAPAPRTPTLEAENMPESQEGDVLVQIVRYRMHGPGCLSDEISDEDIALERNGQVIWRKP